MQKLTPEGQQLIDESAEQYHVSVDAVMSMLQSVMAGNGTMAQFNHPEFGGAGQWMPGGMTMVSDMFNHHLKSQVEGLCHALSTLLSSTSPLTPTAPSQSQQQGAGSRSFDHGPVGSVSLFVAPEPGTSGHWWPEDLGMPNSTGAQNQVRYAYFAQSQRLAIEVEGRVTVYDTLDHQISGFSQQQSGGSSLSFSSQHGLVDVSQLPVIAPDGDTQPTRESESPSEPSTPEVDSAAEVRPQATQTPRAQPTSLDMDIFTTIEKLGALKEQGLLTEEEFTNKKSDLLSRL